MTASKAYVRLARIHSICEGKLGEIMNRVRILRTAAALLLTFLGVICISSCGGGNMAITVQVFPNTSQTVDEGQSLAFTATLQNDTANAGVAWTFTGTACSGNGCGTLTNVTKTSVTYNAPNNISAPVSAVLTATARGNAQAIVNTAITIVLLPTFSTTCPPTTCIPPGGQNGIAYSFSFSGTGAVTGGVPPITYSVASGGLPSGLTLNTDGVIRGIPNSTILQTSTFTVMLKDSGVPPVPATSPVYTITVTPPPVLSITTPTNGLPVGNLHVPYANGAISITGGVPPFTWSYTGTLPPGLTLNTTTGQITGIPTLAGPDFAFTITVTDQTQPTNQSKSQPFFIDIQQPAPMELTPTPLPSGPTAAGYVASLQGMVSGGIAPYTWVVTAGQLPPGLTLDPSGVISGTPSIATTANFTLQVSDSESSPNTQVASAPFSVTITPGASNNTLLMGNYAFHFNGFNGNGVYAVAGQIAFDGLGNILAGVEDINADSGVTSGAALTGTYSIQSNGFGSMQVTATNSMHATLVTTYDLVLDSSGGARYIEDDMTGIHGSGILKPQTNTPFVAANFNGNYAFEFTGGDLSKKPMVMAGVIHADGSSMLTPGTADSNEGGTALAQFPISGGFTVTTTDVNVTTPTTATVVITRGSATFTTPSTPALLYSFYFVSPTELYFIAQDPINVDAFHPRLSGEMILQQPSAVFNKAAMNGASVASGIGLDTSASAFAGLLSADGNGNASLTYDQNDAGVISSVANPPGTYSVTANGRVAFTNLGSRVAVAYLTGPSQGFLIGTDAAVTSGFLDQQSGVSPFNASFVQGNYTLSAPGTPDTQAGSIAGQLFADGVSGLTGTVDEVDASGTKNLGQAFSATFTVAANGRGTITPANPPPTGIPATLVLYVVSPSRVRVVSSTTGDTHPQPILLDH
jgi:Putative Ig domain